MLSSRKLMYKFVMVISLSLYVISISQPWLILYTGSPSWSVSISRFWSFQVVTDVFRRGELLNSYILHFQDFWFFSEFSHLYYGWFLVFVLQILGIITGAISIVKERVKDRPLPITLTMVCLILSLVLLFFQSQFYLLKQYPIGSLVERALGFPFALVSVILWTFPLWNDRVKHEVGKRRIMFLILLFIESAIPAILSTVGLVAILEFYIKMGGGSLVIDWKGFRWPIIGVESRGAGTGMDIHFVILGLTCIPLFFDSMRLLYKEWKSKKRRETIEH